MDSNENSGDFFLDSGLDDYCEYLRNDLFDEDFNFWDELTDDFIGGIIATVLIVLLLIFGGEFMCSLFFGSWQLSTELNPTTSFFTRSASLTVPLK